MVSWFCIYVDGVRLLVWTDSWQAVDRCHSMGLGTPALEYPRSFILFFDTRKKSVVEIKGAIVHRVRVSTVVDFLQSLSCIPN